MHIVSHSCLMSNSNSSSPVLVPKLTDLSSTLACTDEIVMFWKTSSLISSSCGNDASRSLSSKKEISGLGKHPLSDRGTYLTQNPGTIDKNGGFFSHSDNCLYNS